MIDIIALYNLALFITIFSGASLSLVRRDICLMFWIYLYVGHYILFFDLSGVSAYFVGMAGSLIYMLFFFLRLRFTGSVSRLAAVLLVVEMVYVVVNSIGFTLYWCFYPPTLYNVAMFAPLIIALYGIFSGRSGAFELRRRDGVDSLGVRYVDVYRSFRVWPLSISRSKTEIS